MLTKICCELIRPPCMTFYLSNDMLEMFHQVMKSNRSKNESPRIEQYFFEKRNIFEGSFGSLSCGCQHIAGCKAAAEINRKKVPCVTMLYILTSFGIIMHC